MPAKRKAKPKSRAKAPAQMVVTILGCGTSVGVPMLGRVMPWHKQPRNQRLRASILIEPYGGGGPAILVDTSPDLRQQALRFFPKKPRLDAVLMTHEHADHLHGIDDVRPFNFIHQRAIPFYGERRTLDKIRLVFDYIFNPPQVGGGVPDILLHEVASDNFALELETEAGKKRRLEVVPLPLIHGQVSVLGFRIGSVAYLTDLSEIPESTFSRLENLDLLILDCLRPKPHTTNLHIEKSLEYARRIKAKKTVFTHMGSEIEYESFRKSFPPRMAPAFDGMKIRL